MSRRRSLAALPCLLVTLAVTLAVASRGAQAQASPATPASNATAPMTATDSLYARAADLVRTGNGDAGRALVDSALARAVEGTPAYGEGLYWRAALATSAAAAERDYKRVIVEYAASPRAEDALLTLAQLELARGDRARAIAHLERLQTEHPSSPQRARAYVWMARARFDLRQVAEGCAALRGAEGAMATNDVELRTQVEFLSGRCAQVAVAAETTATPTPAKPPARPDATPGPAPTKPAAAADAESGWSVQVAAYDTKREADALVKKLVARGFKARVVGGAKPYRVRIGSYPTRGEASAALGRMKKQSKLDGFVTRNDD